MIDCCSVFSQEGSEVGVIRNLSLAGLWLGLA